MMRDGFAAVEKDRDIVTAKNRGDCRLIILKPPREHRDFPVTPPGADESQYLPRRQRGLRLRIGASDDA